MKTPMVTMQEKYTIKYLYEQKNSVREISRKLEITSTTVQNFIKNELNKKHINRKNRPGRKFKFTRSDKQKLFETKKLNNLLSPTKLAGKMKEIFDLSATGRTVMNYLKSDGFYAGKLVSKPDFLRFKKISVWKYAGSNLLEQRIF